jgi:hypothetical protein
MHVLISTFGTQGDIQPFIALGKGLVTAGHSVTLCTSEDYRRLVVAHGLGYVFMGSRTRWESLSRLCTTQMECRDLLLLVRPVLHSIEANRRRARRLRRLSRSRRCCSGWAARYWTMSSITTQGLWGTGLT